MKEVVFVLFFFQTLCLISKLKRQTKLKLTVERNHLQNGKERKPNYNYLAKMKLIA